MKLSKFTTAFMSIALLSSVLFLTNCKKDKKTEDPAPVTPVTPAPTPQTNTQKLSDKNFKIVAMTVNPGINDGTTIVTDIYAQMDDCSKDDLTIFKTNGTVSFDEGAVRCNTSDPQTTTGTWVWNSNETVLTVTEAGENTSFTIVTNDGTTLKATTTENIGGTNYVFTITWTKQ